MKLHVKVRMAPQRTNFHRKISPRQHHHTQTTHFLLLHPHSPPHETLPYAPPARTTHTNPRTLTPKNVEPKKASPALSSEPPSLSPNESSAAEPASPSQIQHTAS